MTYLSTLAIFGAGHYVRLMSTDGGVPKITEDLPRDIGIMIIHHNEANNNDDDESYGTETQ